jgi:uncharacterized delta-60 repeat protein
MPPPSQYPSPSTPAAPTATASPTSPPRRGALRRWCTALTRALALAALTLTATYVWAAAGDLDPSFSGDGKANTPFFTDANASAAAYAVALQADGKIVVAGSASPYQGGGGGVTSDFALARYHPNGSLDTSFSGDGKLTTNVFGGQDYAYAVAVQTDGKILAAGAANVNAASFFNRFTLVRYNSNGSIDTSFGSAGIVSTDFFGNNSEATAIALQTDGKIVVAGVASDGVANQFALVRYLTNGSLDTSFGVGGKVTTSFFGFDDSASAVRVQADGKIVVAGQAYPGGANTQFALARYTSSGSLDPTFGTGGKVTTDFFGGNDAADALILQTDGKIVAAGMAYPLGTGIDHYAAARYNTDGSLDTSFGNAGKTSVEFTSAYARRLAAVGQADGKIVLAGWGVDSASGFDHFQLLRLNVNGSLDTSFSGDGKQTTTFFGSQNQAFALAVQGDGKLIAAGSAYNLSGFYSEFALARYDGGAGVVPGATLDSLSLSPTSVASGGSATGVLRLSAAAPSGGALIALTDTSTAVSLPASASVPAGGTSVSFPISTSAVSTTTTVTISGSYAGVSRSAVLTLTPSAPATTVNLTVTATGRSGERITSSPAGINVTVGSSQTAGFATNTNVTLTVASGRTASWSGACSSGGSRTRSCTFRIGTTAAVTANIR